MEKSAMVKGLNLKMVEIEISTTEKQKSFLCHKCTQAFVGNQYVKTEIF